MQDPTDNESESAPLLRVMALHALAYCTRLFYLEEVEEIRVADDRVFAGRRLHLELQEDDGDDWLQFELESPNLGIRGKVDCLRRRDGALIPYEHKRGRSRASGSSPSAWESDELQAIAYGFLVREATGEAVPEARIRYHADRKLVRVALDGTARLKLERAVEQARVLRQSLSRPPVTQDERRCVHCSLAPVCLPEEERLLQDQERPALRLFPEHHDRQTLHVTQPGTRVGRDGLGLIVQPLEGDKTQVPIHTVDQVVLHGYAQISSQALALCQQHEVGVHWLSGGGRYLGSFAPGAGQVQRRLRQYEALREPSFVLGLARRLVEAKIQHQLGLLLRNSRGEPRSQELEDALLGMRHCLRHAPHSETLDELRGHEGLAARHYFEALALRINAQHDPAFHLRGRNRRPPRDRVNCLLSFGYSLLYRDCVAACLGVGLEPAFGFFHQPRSAAHPLALDLQELFRVALVDIVVLGSLGRDQWDPDADFKLGGAQVWLSDSGRRKLIELYERRKEDTWKHPALGYSLSYARHIELEARLLEKEWTGSPGLFALTRLR